MRKAAKEMLGTNLTLEAALFTFSLKSGGLEIRAAPYVYIPNHTEKSVQLLEKVWIMSTYSNSLKNSK